MTRPSLLVNPCRRYNPLRFAMTRWTCMVALALLFTNLNLSAAQEVQEGSEAAEAPAVPTELVWLPPANVKEVCTPDTFNHFTRHYCAHDFYFYKEPDADCCEGLALYYGPNTTRPSRNCFCDADVWAEFASHTTGFFAHYYEFSTAFTICAAKGFPVGYNAEPGVGYCWGVPPSDEELEHAHMEHTDDEVEADAFWDATSGYFRKLHKDETVTFAFVSGIFSGIGVLLVSWPLLVDSVISTINAYTALRK